MRRSIVIGGAFAALTLAALINSAPANAQTYSDSFATVASTGTGVSFNGTSWGFFFNLGNSVEQTYGTTSLNSVNSLDLDIDITNNVLLNAAFVNFDIRVNGTTVDSFTVNEGFTGNLFRSASFAPIAGLGDGDDYTVLLIETNQVAGGEGSVRVASPGGENVTLSLDGGAAAPEPASLALLALGGIGFFARKRR
jgi:hypothetical protein